MSDKLISRADLSLIERSLSNLAGSIDYVNNRVDQVDDNVKIVYNEVEKLANEFREYVEMQSLANRKAEAKMNLSAIRDKLKDNSIITNVVPWKIPNKSGSFLSKYLL